MVQLRRTGAAVIVGGGLIAIPAVTPPAPGTQVRAVALTTGDTADSSLGNGTALIFGTTGNPFAGPNYTTAVDTLYLHPRGFGGSIQAPWTPQGLYPVTGVKSLPTDTSLAQGQQILDATIRHEITGGHTDAANPVVVFGWSQSANLSAMTIPQLAEEGVPGDAVHFIWVGYANNPNGGMMERFDVPAGTSPSIPSLGITFNGTFPDNLYPTDVYTIEYDGFADFPQYPLNFLADLNAALGILFGHITYLNLQPEQIADAIRLPTSAADTMTNYYLIPAEGLPLVDPLRFLPVVGQPLYDLLEPDLRILVNLGYGSIADGWSPGPADVPTAFGLWPTDIDPAQLLTALADGAQRGIGAAVADLLDPATYDVTASILDNPLTNQLVGVVHTMGYTDATDVASISNLPALLGLARTALSEFLGFPISDATLLSSPTDILNDLTATVAADYASLLPMVDTANALLTSLPAYDAALFLDQLSAGDPVRAIGDPIAADVWLVPLAIGFGATPPLQAIAGTLLNLVGLIPGL